MYMVGPTHSSERLLEALQFLESSTNTFQIRYGMITPTLFDVVVITGLWPTSDVFDPTQQDKCTISFDSKWASYNVFIVVHFETQIEDMSNEEHIAFLTLWLYHYIFCFKSLKVSKSFISLDNQLHEGWIIYLGQLILGSLYESLGIASNALKLFKPKANLSIIGPF